jgi:hypothetical protein
LAHHSKNIKGTHWKLGEHIENLIKTHWELKGNIVGTHWEPGKNEKKKKILYPSPHKLKGKKARHLECMLGPSHRLQKNVSSQKSLSPFLAWAICPLQKNTLPILVKPFGLGFLPYTNNYENSRKKTHESSESPNYGGFLFVHF